MEHEQRPGVDGREDAEVLLERSEERYRTLFDTMAEGFAVLELVRDESGRAVDAIHHELNAALERQSGLRREQAIGRPMSELQTAEDTAAIIGELHAVAERGEPRTFEKYVDQQQRWYEISAYPRGGDWLSLFFRDISLRKRAEEKLRSSESQHAFLLRLADALGPMSDPSSIEVTACRLLGEHLDVDRAYYVEVDEATGVAVVAQDHLRGDSPSLAGAHRIADLGWVVPPMRSGEVLVITDVSASPLVPDADRPMMDAVRIAAHVNAPIVKGGELVGALCVTEPRPRMWTDAEVELVREVAERIWAAVEWARTERARRESEDRFRRFSEASSDVLWIRNAATLDAEYVSPAFETVYGRAPDDVSQPISEWASLVHPDDRDAVCARLRDAATSGTATADEYRIRRPDGQLRWIRATLFPVAADDGSIDRIGGIERDVTARRQVEAALQELNESLEERVAERTRLVRELTRRLSMAEQEERRRVSSVLHDDLQQVLYGIEAKLGGVLSSDRDSMSERAGEDLEATQRWLETAIATTRRLAVDLSPPILRDEGLSDALQWLRRQMEELHGLHVDIDGDRQARLPDDVRVLLFQIVRELLFNVKKHAHTDRATVTLTEQDGDLVILVVDEGEGFDTRRLDEASDAGGFGLYSARERLQLLGGSLELRSRTGRGTAVEIRVPVGVEAPRGRSTS